MPSQKRVTESNKTGSDGVPDGTAREEPSMVVRTALFVGVTFLLVGLAAWFVATAVSSPRATSLSARQERRHTVKVLEMPAARRETARSMLDHQALVSLADGHRLHLRSVGQQKLALCMGVFESERSPDALRLLRRVREFTREGKKAFPSAEIIGYTPRNSR